MRRRPAAEHRTTVCKFFRDSTGGPHDWLMLSCSRCRAGIALQRTGSPLRGESPAKHKGDTKDLQLAGKRE